MKNSGVPWLGNIPQHWKVMRFSYLFKSRMGATILAEDLSESASIPVYSATEKDGFFGFVDCPRVLLEKGDLVIPARGASIGAVKYVSSPSTSTQTTISCKKLSNKVYPRYIFHWLKAMRNELFFYDETAIPQLTVEQVSSNPTLLPPLHEQQAIADFLDRETARIDDLIKKQEQLIELLDEKRVSLINQAVTKGLDPNVPVKDSGIPWLGEVPAHWEVKKIRFITESIKTGKTPSSTESKYYDCGDIPWYGPSSLASASINVGDPVKLITKEAISENAAKLFPSNAVFITGIGASLGRVGVLKYGGSCNQQLLVAVLNSNICFHDFFAYQALSISKVFLDRAQFTTMPIMNQSELADYEFKLPPPSEQKAIVSYLNSETAKLDQLKEKANKCIELLKEYKTSLISSAVTGKIDVRNYKSGEPINN